MDMIYDTAVVAGYNIIRPHILLQHVCTVPDTINKVTAAQLLERYPGYEGQGEEETKISAIG